MAYIDVDDSSINETMNEEFAKGNIVILKFFTEFCDACMAMDMELEDVDDDNDNVSVIAVDCAECEFTAERYGIVQVPTTIIMKDAGTTLLHKEGIMLSQDIEDVISIG